MHYRVSASGLNFLSQHASTLFRFYLASLTAFDLHCKTDLASRGQRRLPLHAPHMLPCHTGRL